MNVGGTYHIDYQGMNNYAVDDGSGGSTQTMTEDQVNALLSNDANSIWKVQKGDLFLTSGQPYAPGTDPVVNSYGGPPHLPGVEGPRDDIQALSGRLESRGYEVVDLGAQAWEALFEMVRTGQVDKETSRDLRLALQDSKFATKKLSIKEAKVKIEEDKNAAWERFAWAIAATVVSAACAGAGGAIGGSASAASSTAVRGGAMALSGAAAGLGQAVTALGDAVSKETGAQARANQAEIRGKELDLHAEQIDAALEDAKANEQEAKESAQQALKLIQQMVDNQNQAIQKITST